MGIWELLKEIREHKNNTFYAQVDAGFLKAMRHIMNLKDQKTVCVFEQMLFQYFEENEKEFKNYVAYKKGNE